MEDMKWWWDGLTLAREAEAQATPHCTERWLKKNGWQPWFLLNCPGKVLDHRRTMCRHKQSHSLAQDVLEHLVSYNFLNHRPVQMSLPLHLILNKMKQVHTLRHKTCKGLTLSSQILLSLPCGPWSLPSRISNQYFVYISRFTHEYCMSCKSYFS